MYFNIDLENYSEELLLHQDYFIRRWGEILSNKSIHFRKLLQPCSRSILKEALHIMELYEQGILFEHNTIEILEEISLVLPKDTVLRLNNKKDYDFVQMQLSNFLSGCEGAKKQSDVKDSLSKFLNGNLRNIKTILFALLSKLESEDVPKLYSQFLMNELSKDTLGFTAVDNLTELLLSDLFYEGHTKNYLYRWGQSNFIHGTEPNFINRIDKISNLGKKNYRTFECYFIIKLPNGKEYDFLYDNHGSDEIVFYRNFQEISSNQKINNIPAGKLAEFISVESQGAQEPEKQISKIKLQATDNLSAGELAKKRLISFTKFFQLSKTKNREFEDSIQNTVIIIDGDNHHITEVSNKRTGLKLANHCNILSILLSPQANQKYQGLSQILQWYRIIQDSSRESGLVSMWSLLEFLFVNDHTDKRNIVITNVNRYILHYYAKSIAKRCDDVLCLEKKRYKELTNTVKQKIREESEAALKENKKVEGKNEGHLEVTEPKVQKQTEKLKEPVQKEEEKNKEELEQNQEIHIDLSDILHFLCNFKSEAERIYKKQSIPIRYIGLLEQAFIGKKDKLCRWVTYLNDYEEKLKRDLKRAYRIRNMLAHQAFIEDDTFDDTYDKITFYVKVILDDLLFSMSKQPFLSIKQLIILKKISYENFRDKLKRDPILIKEIINPTNAMN